MSATIYQLFLGNRFQSLAKYPANVQKVAHLAAKAYLHVKEQDIEGFIFTMTELKKFVSIAFRSPDKEKLIEDYEKIATSQTAQDYITNFQILIKDAFDAYPDVLN